MDVDIDENKIDKQVKTTADHVALRKIKIQERIEQCQAAIPLTPCYDTDTHLVQFLSDKTLALLACCNKSMYKLARLRKQFISNKICLILDNSSSMQSNNRKSIKIQEMFARKLLTTIHAKAQIAVRLVSRSSYYLVGRYQPLFDGCAASDALLLLEDLFLQPDFYEGDTPLFSTIAQAVSDGFDTIIVLTDGQDTQAQSFADISLYNKPLLDFVLAHNDQLPPDEDEQKYEQSRSRKNRKRKASSDPERPRRITWNNSSNLSSFIQGLSVAITGDKVFLPTIVGLNMSPYELQESSGLVPVHLIHDQDEKVVSQLVEKVRISTVSRESGGGRGSRPKVHLADARYQMAKEHARGFIKGEYKRFPPPDNQHAVSLYISHKQAQLLALERKGIVGEEKRVVDGWELPLKSDRKAGWAFSYSGNHRNLAVQDLTKTRDACMLQFDRLTEEDLKQVTLKTATYNYLRYLEVAKLTLKTQSRKRKRNAQETLLSRAIANAEAAELASKRMKNESAAAVPVPIAVVEEKKEEKKENKQTQLSIEDFMVLAGPKCKKWYEIAKLIPPKFYPVPISTYYWILLQDADGKTAHDRQMAGI